VHEFVVGGPDETILQEFGELDPTDLPDRASAY
jgi:hypothetical protein